MKKESKIKKLKKFYTNAKPDIDNFPSSGMVIPLYASDNCITRTVLLHIVYY